ncbi:nuclear transport factor 2 family protein [Altererythrobacter sp. ZODW24]|uniref:nuclear transport factor 2 family protein n=1 Tax=Altererythrobacter sp. ZODW24 TaxID=2185142 RepID=UPI000DF72DF6|nr:nuclear transport factor 2 family protein [Altererythrobacter sp. ZODW24]
MNRSVISGLGAILLATGLPGCASIEPAAPSKQEVIVSAYVEAYNARDLAAMEALMHPQIQWISVEDGKSVIVADGREELAAQMKSYLASATTTNSTLDGFTRNGRFLAVKETAHWSDANGQAASQSSIAVYELDDGLVLRVWYYPAE